MRPLSDQATCRGANGQQNNSTNAWALQVALSVALLSISAVLLASSFFGEAIWFNDQNGNLVPPHNQLTWAGGLVDEIGNSNPQPGTNNWWTQDGYGGFRNVFPDAFVCLTTTFR